MPKSLPNSWHRLLLLAIILAGFSLRVGALNASSLWLDELIQVQLASLPLAKLPAAMFAHANVPVDILITKILLMLGEQDGWLRLSSAFVGTLSLPLIYLVTRKLVPAPAPTLAMAMLAISPLAVQYNREIRPYSTFLMLTLLSIFLFLKALEQPRYWLGFVPAYLATLHTHLFSIALLPVFGLYWLIFQALPIWHSPRRWHVLLAPTMLGIVAFLFVVSPFSPDYLGRFSRAVLQGVIGPTAAESLDLGGTGFAFPGEKLLLQRLPVDFTGAWPVENIGGSILAVLGLALGLAGIISLRHRPRALGFLLLWLLLVPAIVIFTLYQRDHWFSARYIIHALPAGLILMGAGIIQSARWVGGLEERPRSDKAQAQGARTIAGIAVVIFAAYLALASPALLKAYSRPHENLRDAAAYLAEVYQPDTLIVAPLVGPYLGHYLPPNVPVVDLQSGGAVELAARDFKQLLILQTTYSRLLPPDAPWINPENAVALFRPGVVIYRGPAGEMAEIRLAERLERESQLQSGADFSLEDLRQLAADARTLKKWDTAITVLERLLQSVPQDSGLWADLGFAQQMLEQYPEAIAAYDQAVALNPNQSWAYLLAANSYRLSGDPAAGLPYAQKAVETAPKLKDAWASLGHVQLALDQSTAAMESFRKGLDLQPNELDMRFGFAQAASASNSPDAERAWLTLLQSDPPAYMIEAACTHLAPEAHPLCQKQP